MILLLNQEIFGLRNSRVDWLCFIDFDNLLCHSLLEIIIKNNNKFPKC